MSQLFVLPSCREILNKNLKPGTSLKTFEELSFFDSHLQHFLFYFIKNKTHWGYLKPAFPASKSLSETEQIQWYFKLDSCNDQLVFSLMLWKVSDELFSQNLYLSQLLGFNCYCSKLFLITSVNEAAHHNSIYIASQYLDLVSYSTITLQIIYTKLWAFQLTQLDIFFNKLKSFICS